MVFSRLLFSKFRGRKAPGKSPTQKGNTATTPNSQNKRGKRHCPTIPNLLQFLKRKPNKVACSQHTDSPSNSKSNVPHGESDQQHQCLNQKATQDHENSTKAIINVNSTTTSSMTKTEASRKQSRATSLCRVRFNLPPRARTACDSPQRPSTPQTARPSLNQGSLRTSGTQPQPKPEVSCENSPRCSRNKCNNCWTIPPNSHPLSQRQCAENLYCSMQNPETNLESREINTNFVDVVAEVEDSDNDSEIELSNSASCKCCSEDFLVSLVNPLSFGAIDRIKRYCSVDVDTDFVANFNYDFLNDNII